MKKKLLMIICKKIEKKSQPKEQILRLKPNWLPIPAPFAITSSGLTIGRYNFLQYVKMLSEPGLGQPNPTPPGQTKGKRSIPASATVKRQEKHITVLFTQLSEI